MADFKSVVLFLKIILNEITFESFKVKFEHVFAY